MIPWILLSFYEFIPGISVLKYVTIRSVLAAATSLLMSIFFGPMTIRLLKKLNSYQPILDVSPQSHQAKSGTPTMGGVLIIGVIITNSMLWCDFSNVILLVALFALVSFAVVGFYDDIKKLKFKQNLGLSSRQKMLFLTLLSLMVALVIVQFQLRGFCTSQIYIPFYRNLLSAIDILVVPWICLVIVGTSNAVNLTDGLDGLAIGGIFIVSLTFAILSYITGHIKIADYLTVIHVPGSSELAVFMAIISGASLGFLWFNAYPAEVFMGDTGSLALGGTLGTVAVLIRQELLLVIAGSLFVFEAMSVIIQVGGFKLLGGKRIFRMAPFHHHLELLGIKETKVVVRLLITVVVCSILALTSLKIR